MGRGECAVLPFRRKKITRYGNRVGLLQNRATGGSFLYWRLEAGERLQTEVFQQKCGRVLGVLIASWSRTFPDRVNSYGTWHFFNLFLPFFIEQLPFFWVFFHVPGEGRWKYVHLAQLTLCTLVLLFSTLCQVSWLCWPARFNKWFIAFVPKIGMDTWCKCHIDSGPPSLAPPVCMVENMDEVISIGKLPVCGLCCLYFCTSGC